MRTRIRYQIYKGKEFFEGTAQECAEWLKIPASKMKYYIDYKVPNGIRMVEVRMVYDLYKRGDCVARGIKSMNQVGDMLLLQSNSIRHALEHNEGRWNDYQIFERKVFSIL